MLLSYRIGSSKNSYKLRLLFQIAFHILVYIVLSYFVVIMALPSKNAMTKGGTEDAQCLTDEDTLIDPLSCPARTGMASRIRKHTKRGMVNQKKRASNAQEMLREKIVSCLSLLFYIRIYDGLEYNYFICLHRNVNKNLGMRG